MNRKEGKEMRLYTVRYESNGDVDVRPFFFRRGNMVLLGRKKFIAVSEELMRGGNKIFRADIIKLRPGNSDRYRAGTLMLIPEANSQSGALVIVETLSAEIIDGAEVLVVDSIAGKKVILFIFMKGGVVEIDNLEAGGIRRLVWNGRDLVVE
jgi:hypothetical protein